MDTKRAAWIQTPDLVSYDIGEVGKEEIQKLWGSRWAQKCIRDASEEVALEKFSPLPHRKLKHFSSPQLGFENGNATLIVSPWVDVTSAILYGTPISNFGSWTVSLIVKRGSKFLGIFPKNFSFEMVVSQEEALELVTLFYDFEPDMLVPKARVWKDEINEQYHRRFAYALFF